MPPINKGLMNFGIIAALFMTPAGHASADAGTDFLESLVGNWKGRGIMQTKPESQPEAVICRFKSKLSQNGRRINNTGSCAGAQAKAKVAGSLSYNPATGKFTGQMLSTGNEDGRSTSTGVLSGKTLSLKTVRFDTRQNVMSRGTVRIKTSGDGELSLVSRESTVETQTTFTSSKLTLKRR